MSKSYVYVALLSEEYSEGDTLQFVAHSIDAAMPRVAAVIANIYDITEWQTTEQPWGIQFTGIDQYGDEVYLDLERSEVI